MIVPTFYGQVVRFQRLCTNRLDFESRVCFLFRILQGRGYIVGLLSRQFYKAVSKFISEFQKWDIPLDFKDWFNNMTRYLISTSMGIGLFIWVIMIYVCVLPT